MQSFYPKITIFWQGYSPKVMDLLFTPAFNVFRQRVYCNGLSYVVALIADARSNH